MAPTGVISHSFSRFGKIWTWATKYWNHLRYSRYVEEYRRGVAHAVDERRWLVSLLRLVCKNQAKHCHAGRKVVTDQPWPRYSVCPIAPSISDHTTTPSPATRVGFCPFYLPFYGSLPYKFLTRTPVNLDILVLNVI